MTSGTLNAKRRYFLRSDKLNEVKSAITNQIPEYIVKNIFKGKRYEIIELDSEQFLMIDEKPGFIKIEDIFVPFLREIQDIEIEADYVVVDTGAVPYVCNGADIMAPGIVEIDPKIKRNRLVIVVEERHRRPLAIGISLMDGGEIKDASSGKCIQNLHYVGDKYWKALES